MKRRVIGAAFATALALGVLAGPALAAQPASPGCFGTERAAWLAANSGREWGAIAPERAGDNGQINRDAKVACGGAPAT